jgi:hypothetical protein
MNWHGEKGKINCDDYARTEVKKKKTAAVT